jgi:hypothetical protein
MDIDKPAFFHLPYNKVTDLNFFRYFKFVRQVALEDFELCEVAQRNLEIGVYGEGILNPRKENGVVFYQGKVREGVYRQYAMEKETEEREKKGGNVEIAEGKAIEVQ